MRLLHARRQSRVSEPTKGRFGAVGFGQAVQVAARQAARSNLAAAAVAVALVLSISACQSKDGPGAVADAFMGAYYVAIDLQAAQDLTAGLAWEKLAQELELTSEAEIDGDTRKPRINFMLEEASEDGDRAQFVFLLDIRPPGADPFERTSMLMLKREEESWKVTNFSDTDRRS
jgi:hypothetical protein